ncbi:MAG: YceI family protein [Acidimicrobiales bacterium]
MTEATATTLAGMVGTWQLDPKHTTVEFHTTAMWGLAKVTGTVRAVQGSGLRGDDGGVSGELVLDATSIDTKIKWRDKHLRGRDFLDVGTYPTFTFTASEATPSTEGTVGIKGLLRIKDQSHPIELVATLTTPSVERITISGEVAIDRRQWGVSRAPMGAGLANRVVVVAQFVRL